MLLPLHRYLVLSSVLVLGMGCTAAAQQTLGELYATDARVKGSVILAGSGTSVLSGSSIAAGAQTATLKLERGGSVLVCSGTNLSVNASQSGRELMFSMNSGNLEMNYPLGAAADTLLTPDLRLLLPRSRHRTHCCEGDSTRRHLRSVVAVERRLNRGFRDHGRCYLSGETKRSRPIQGRTSQPSHKYEAKLRVSDVSADTGRESRTIAASCRGIQAHPTRSQTGPSEPKRSPRG